ncbi:sushi, von Willebrand factor type A, EGF and pentraxin domain-containing protein 1 isoform X1 [Silurus asotus]|uniref:Sushi, von Willebrand factor type A, EGF and pentraxin domain-containing protein 1 isoform X1 n=1 Tax=Silurus asotus TaxID=30991 RepID=A0AAD5FA34_SILAS|nr:sushi, von Willebrand factor type A, EGF and pentraxin domain-containing protein 1 isoform X1 [Silurus asotus]
MAVIVWTCVMLVLSVHLVDKETVSYVCNVGFRLKGSKSELLCVNGTWKPKSVECKQIKCKKLTIPNASLNTGRQKFNTQVNIRCQEGYNIKGPNVITCGGQGVWIPAPPTCEKVIPVKVTCPPPAVPNSSGQDGYKAEYKVGERAAISCQKGYRLIGSSEITCLEDGQWEELPNCRLVEGRCPPPPYVPNAHTEHNDQTHYEPNTTLRLKCNLGYRMARGPSTISCRDGQWTDVQLMCEKKKCGSAGEVENGRYHYTGSSFGDVATARCFEGYQLIGVGVRHCTNNGWDGRVAVCEANQCPDPPEVPDADVNVGTSGIIRPGYVASYSCRLGTLIGESEIVCTEDGTWSREAPRCNANQCPDPPEVPDADVNVGTSGIIRPGYVASYSCRLGTLIGESEIVCTEDGTWSREAPRCNVVPCPAPNIQYGFIFSGVRRQYNSGLSVTIKCNPGWRLFGSSVSKCWADGEWRPRLPKCACNNNTMFCVSPPFFHPVSLKSLLSSAHPSNIINCILIILHVFFFFSPPELFPRRTLLRAEAPQQLLVLHQFSVTLHKKKKAPVQ